MSEALAVFGGSFDPPHAAHMLVASYVLGTAEIDQLLVVPTAQHPFDKALTPFRHRKHMCELALSHLRRVEVSDIEARLGGESRTLRTLQALQAERPGARLRLVLGSDLVPETSHWHNFPAIAALAPPIVVQRAGHETDPEQPALPPISSTDVRRRLREGVPVSGLLCPAVADYIRAERLYLEHP